MYSQNTKNDAFFEHLGTSDGLSQNDVNCIYQDNLGFMWFGTHDGLNKYDGYNFTVYNPDPNNPKSINSNLIFALDGDEQGNLWIGTSGKGVNYFNRKTETFTHYVNNPEDPNSLNGNDVQDILVDSKNRIWVITTQGLNVADLNNEPVSFKHFNFNKLESQLNNVLSVFEDSKGKVYVGTTKGLYELIEENNNLPDTLKLVSSDNFMVRSISEIENGILLLAIYNGFFTYNPNAKSNTLKRAFNSNTSTPFNSVRIEGNTVWAGSDSGLFKFQTTNSFKNLKLVDKYVYHPQEKNSLSKNIIKSLYRDKTGILWIGTNGGGINKLDPTRKPFLHIKSSLNPASLSYDKIRSIYEDSPGNLWVGTEGGDLNMLPKQENSNSYLGFKKFDYIQKTFAITEVQKKDKKILLVGGENYSALLQLDITDINNIKQIDYFDFSSITGSVFSILEDSNKNLWIGTYNKGINRWLFDKTSNTYKKDYLSHNERDYLSIPSNIIRNIKEDKDGNIWFATGKGLSMLPKNEISKENPKFETFKYNPDDKNSISHDYILELFEDSKGILWIGTFGGGVNKYIPPIGKAPPKFMAYKEKDGLPNNVVKGILEDDNGNLWISTNKGLSKFDPDNETFKNYDVNDGLQDNEFQELARLKRKNGDLIFGGTNGFNVFNPSEIRDNPIEAETIITKFSVFNKPVHVGDTLNNRVILKHPISQTDHIKLKYKENSFSFEFAGLHYSAPEKNNFLYMLEGFDKDWIYTNSKKRFATYTNLSPATYTLKVKASNNDNVWDSTPSLLKITVAPPYYLTNFAFLVYSLILLGLLLLYRRFTIIKTTKKHALELEHLEKEKNNELQRIKLEFFTNITHEFTTPLTLIKGPLNFLQKQGDNLENEVKQEQYKLMQKNTDYLLRLISQLLDFRKINQGKMRLVMRNSNIVNFIKEVSEPFQFMARKQHIAFNVEASNNNLKSWFDHDSVEKIMNNLLSNAFKFTPESGIINVSISEIEGSKNLNLENDLSYIEIKVKDTGAGMDEVKVSNIFKRFFSEKNKDKKNSEGMGIGLAFVESLVLLHQGSIKVDSKVNQGTTFTVRLPKAKKAYTNIPEITCKDVSESDFHVRSSESDSMAIGINDDIVDESLSKESSETPTLLVVDDNEDIRIFIKQALKTKYTIYTAENGADAIELLQNINPKIIITDIMMPIMDGIEFCKHIKSKKETSHIPVVMLTAKLSQENEIIGLKIGADAYIRKPFDIELLELKLSNILKHRQKLRDKFNLDITLQPKEITVTSIDERFLNQAIEIVEKHMMNTDFNVEMMVKEMGFSRTNLYKKFKEITGLSSSEFIRNIRLKRAVQLFEQSDFSVKEIMYMTGFNTSSYFAKCFKKQFGVKPSEYVRQKKTKS
ncbi:two-component regulator propeller domain-containing protein [Algibacter sp. 2305UL17-15]|uniref:two-component regulator propeller domain-containing protein n=1 Tax=Algibacter sp. 2305UL17-15 TaxID=3231268 RepID=UPI00345A3F50